MTLVPFAFLRKGQKGILWDRKSRVLCDANINKTIYDRLCRHGLPRSKQPSQENYYKLSQ